MIRLIVGDAVEQMRTLPSESFDACVTDPPYGLEFMNVAWDTFKDGRKGGARARNNWGDFGSREHARNADEAGHVARKKSLAFQKFNEAWAVETLRVLKPGAYLLAFGGTRTHHRLTCAIEDAGFVIQDCLMWLHGQGFPKGKSQLKPAWEPIILARKPGKGAALNIDATRIGMQDSDDGRRLRHGGSHGKHGIYGDGVDTLTGGSTGRWPANVVLSHEPECQEVGTRRVKGSNVPGPRGAHGAFGQNGVYSKAGGRHDEVPFYTDPDGLETVPAYSCEPSCAVRLLDEQAGELGLSKGGRNTGKTNRVYGDFVGLYDPTPPGFGDRGGASRFFYCAKASATERGSYNDHPTVKPLALMSWLVTLVTPPNGQILDPFCGSGSTLVAADRLGFSATGIDSDAHALDIARRRLAEDGGMFSEVEVS